MTGFWKGAIVGALVAVAVSAASAVAGNGIGAVFNLGKTNSVDQTSRLAGNDPDAELVVENTAKKLVGTIGIRAKARGTGIEALGQRGINAIGTLAGGVFSSPRVRGSAGIGVDATGWKLGGSFASDFTGLESTGAAGYGVEASTTGLNKAAVYAHHDSAKPGYGVLVAAGTGTGVVASGSVAGGTFTGQGTGDGVQGQSAAAGKSGVWGHHDGGEFGYGVFAESANGAAIGIRGNANSPPIIVDGDPFPNAVSGLKDGGIALPRTGTTVTVATLTDIPAGIYVLLAKTSVRGGSEAATVDCRLQALSVINISEPTRPEPIGYCVFWL
jgi:hypothetical protein